MATGKSGDAKEASTVRNDAMPQSRINIQRMKNVLLIWLDKNIDDNNEDCRNTVTKLRRVVNEIHKFTDVDQCIDFLTDNYNGKVIMVISRELCQEIVPLIHDIVQLHTIFAICSNNNTDEQRAKEWPKFKEVFTEISPICEALKQAAQQCEHNAISMSFVATNTGDASSQILDRLDPAFMYTQILKEILLTINFEEKHIEEFSGYCREEFLRDGRELQHVDKFEREYHNKTPICWYTSEGFLYSMLNCALRLMDVDIIVRMGFFIKDLHRHIHQLHSEQCADHSSREPIMLYRGQGLSKEDFEKMTNTKGGLISFNNFLSTSKNHEISFLFAESNQGNPDSVGIFFIIKIDPAQSTTPFASIRDISSFQEEDEVLFSMHTVFRINDIEPMAGTDSLFNVNLTLTADNDRDLCVLTDRIREETFPDDKGWYRLGSVLLAMRQSKKAQEVYEVLLDQTTNKSEKQPIYSQLGLAKYDQGEYEEAITFFDKSLAIRQQLFPPNHFTFALPYANIGLVYYNMGDYPKALSSHEKALAIRQQSLPPNHPDLASSYMSIGSAYYSMGHYPKALSSYEKALAMRQHSLPPNHPDLAGSYNNIGNVYNIMGDYPKALPSYEKAFAIQEQSLPPNHPSLAMSYCNIGVVYYNMGDYPKALSSYEKALAIQQQSLPPNHPDSAASYNNIGMVYGSMGDYPKSLSSHQKALAIRQQSLPSNHPDLAASYNNIGAVYNSMVDYPKALSSYENALAIQQQSLPPNHLDLAASYNNIGAVYNSMVDYPKAPSSYENALAIQQQSLPPNHPDLASSFNKIGSVYEKTGDYSKALSCHEKAIAIQQQSLPPNHPDLASSYNNIGSVYEDTGDYSKALSCHEKALAIQQQSLPSNHPYLALSYYNIGLVYENTGNYSEAVSYYERAIDIGQESLPANHPRLQSCRKNLELLKKKL
jgi:tetratricopeptide (TPR) repeat protein